MKEFFDKILDVFPIDASLKGLASVDYAIEAATYCFILGLLTLFGMLLIIREITNKEREEEKEWRKILISLMEMEIQEKKETKLLE